MNTSINNLNNDICEISEWEIQLKMCFSSDKSKQRNEVIFSGKIQQLSYDSISFIHNCAQEVLFQKHLGMHLDIKSNLKLIQCNVILPINCAVRGTSGGKLYQEIDSQTLQH